MAKINALTETDLATVKRANDALQDLFNLRLELIGRGYTTDADIEKLGEIYATIGAGMQLFKGYLKRVNERARNGHKDEH